MRLKNWQFTICFAIATAFIGIRAQGQAISGDLTGTVTDVLGAVVPNATVTATNSATDVKSSAHANSAGLYRISNLLPGNYSISADSPGFTHFELRGVSIQLNQAATVNITMSLGAVSTTVEVNAAADDH
jgi:Carboxypeptidase regulatory-like domain